MDLRGKLLVAMPGMGDPRFAHAVIYIADHSDRGAMGLMVNKPAEDVALRDVLEHIEPEAAERAETPGKGADMPVHIGGPVETERGFVLHSRDYRSAMQTLDVSGEFSVTATLDVLEDIVAGRGPARAQLMLGYAGWGPGQLEGEIAENGWLTCDAGLELVFDLPDADKWAAALRSLGVDPTGLSAASGHA